MNAKITLNQPELVTVAEPGKQVATRNITSFEVRQIGVGFNAGQVIGLQATLMPLDDKDKPVRYAQPVRKNFSAGEVAALNVNDNDIVPLIKKMFPLG